VLFSYLVVCKLVGDRRGELKYLGSRSVLVPLNILLMYVCPSFERQSNHTYRTVVFKGTTDGRTNRTLSYDSTLQISVSACPSDYNRDIPYT